MIQLYLLFKQNVQFFTVYCQCNFLHIIQINEERKKQICFSLVTNLRVSKLINQSSSSPPPASMRSTDQPFFFLRISFVVKCLFWFLNLYYPFAYTSAFSYFSVLFLPLPQNPHVYETNTCTVSHFLPLNLTQWPQGWDLSIWSYLQIHTQTVGW